jgi:hypothetical protein
MSDHVLDYLPLNMLIALQEAMADPTADGQERARLRAIESGIHIHCINRPDGPEGRYDPLPMPPASGGEEGVISLVFPAGP